MAYLFMKGMSVEGPRVRVPADGKGLVIEPSVGEHTSPQFDLWCTWPEAMRLYRELGEALERATTAAAAEGKEAA